MSCFYVCCRRTGDCGQVGGTKVGRVYAILRHWQLIFQKRAWRRVVGGEKRKRVRKTRFLFADKWRICAVSLLSAFMPVDGDGHGGHGRWSRKGLQTCLSRISDLFAPYLLRIKVPKSGEGTKKIRSKWVCEGGVKGEEGEKEGNAASEDGRQENGVERKIIWMIKFRYDAADECEACLSWLVAERKEKASGKNGRCVGIDHYRNSLLFYRKTINFFCFSFVGPFFMLFFAHRISEIMYHV